MSRKLSKQEKENQALIDNMVEQAEKARAEMKKDTSRMLMNRRRRKKLKPIIVKLYKEEKISESRYEKLINYLVDKEFDKIEKYLKKKFSKYLEEPESEDEKPKKKSGKGFEHEILDYLSQF